MPSRPLKEPALRPQDRGHAAFVDDPAALFVGTDLGVQVQQKKLGDCFFLAPLASLAQRRPREIEGAVRKHAEGTYAVRLFHHDVTAGRWTPREVAVDAKLPEKKGKPIYATTVSGRGLWVSLFEKAYAEMRGGFSVLNKGGDPSAAIGALTGHHARTTWLQNADLEAVWAELEHAVQGRQITLASTWTDDDARAMLESRHRQGQSTLPAKEREIFSYKRRGLVAGHEYSVWGLSGKGARRRVELRNPWAHREKHTTDDGIFSVSFREVALLFANVTVER